MFAGTNAELFKPLDMERRKATPRLSLKAAKLAAHTDPWATQCVCVAEVLYIHA
jgi:hypothetical protein